MQTSIPGGRAAAAAPRAARRARRGNGAGAGSAGFRAGAAGSSLELRLQPQDASSPVDPAGAGLVQVASKNLNGILRVRFKYTFDCELHTASIRDF